MIIVTVTICSFALGVLFARSDMFERVAKRFPWM